MGNETFEELLLNQKTNIDGLIRLLENAKKDGPTKWKERPKSKFNTKLMEFDELYQMICDDNNKIQVYVQDDPSKKEGQQYFEKKTFERITKVYNEVKKTMLDWVGASCSTTNTVVQDTPIVIEPTNNGVDETTNHADGKDIRATNGTGGTSTSTTTHINETLDLVTMQYDEIMDLIFASANLDTDASLGTITAHLHNLNATWMEFRSEVYKSKVNNQRLKFGYQAVTQKYMHAVGHLNDLLASENKTKRDERQNTQFVLPQLKLPEFTGNTDEWKSFIALYDKMVHENNKLDDALKIEYLKTVVKGSAAKVISHIEPTPENYISCYSLLKKRFDNKREILNKLIDNILYLPKMQQEDAEQLKQMHDTVYESMMSIKNLDIKVDNWDFLLTNILAKKLDQSTLMHYECQLDDIKEPQTLSSFLEYIENRFLALQSVRAKTSFGQNKNKDYGKNKHEKSIRSFKCIFCSSDEHSVFKCQSFAGKDPKQRFDFIKSKNLCLNCFGAHKTKECKSDRTCYQCKKHHNTLLHFESKKNVEKQNTSANVASASGETLAPAINAMVSMRPGTTMLATALVTVVAKNGERTLLRALIDQGSQCSFISMQAMQTLKIKGIKTSIDVYGIGATPNTANYFAELTISPHFDSEFNIQTKAIVLNKLTKISNNVPNMSIPDHLPKLTLADPSFNAQGPIDIILGAAEYGQILKQGLIKMGEHLPIIQETELGWIISGGKIPFGNNQYNNLNVVALVSNIELENKISKLFHDEQFSIENRNEWTDEEQYAEKHFKDTYFRNESGRFVVTIPFKNGMVKPELGNSKKCAMAALYQLEKRFIAKPELKKQYSDFIREYLSMNHMKKVDHFHPDAHYLPHHCVFKDSTTTKIRVVFNASQKTSNQKSLNEQMALGPLMQDDLTSILSRWRKHRIAFCADIEKMYRQIQINKSQTHLQRILWRESPHDSINEYELTTVTYGTANAPFLAIRTLKQLALDGYEKFPDACKVIKNDFYVDDAVSGANSVEEAYEIYKQLREIMGQAGLNLRKWASNSQDLLDKIPLDDQESQAHNGFIKTLGVVWSPQTDTFSFKIAIPHEPLPRTKRQLTAEIASLYDPLGWISPVVIAAKNILQQVWKANINWDEVIPEKMLNQWTKIRSELHLLNEIKIPRSLNYSPNDIMELHGFADASIVGYACCVYVKNVTQNTVRLLIAKARVTPIKEDKNDENITIPRLELSGALLLAEVMMSIQESLKIKFNQIFLWSDSRIVLDWINADPKRYKTFIATKIKKINKLVDRKNWFHVRSEQNAADCASRGMLPSELLSNNEWLSGPKFLREKRVPIAYEPLGEVSDNIETSAHIATALQQQQSMLPNNAALTFFKLKCIIALCFRFIRKCRTKQQFDNFFSVDELHAAEQAIIRIMQSEHFADEIRALRKNDTVKKSSAIYMLSPFLDDDNILRVGGRLKHANITYNSKHQMLLPPKHPVTKLIIMSVHLKCLHGGPRLTESVLKQNYWTTNSQRLIKSVIHKCTECFRANPRPMQQLMAHLPKTRVNMVEKPFTNTAVDYTGAILIKIASGRGYQTRKAYISIFVCMATKAIHIEVVTALTAEAFVAALRRFISRRGAVQNMFSDNGTNFVKANKILIECNDICESEYNKTVTNELVKRGITWHFSPPGAPHFNGLAEAAVKSVKFHLKRTMADAKLTYEELCTLLTQIEACVNSRPLCAKSSDPSDIETLTPAHFLIGQPLILPPETDFSESKVSYLTRWQRVQQMIQFFWKNWKADYLNQLQLRKKWNEKNASPEIDDIVLIRDENLPPAKWQVGRIIDTHAGDDSLIRVVTLRTVDRESATLKSKIMKRPITKICPLPDNRIVSSNVTSICHKPKRSSTILPILLTFLTICANLSRQNHVEKAIISPYQFTRFDHSPGFYFEKINDVFVTGSHWHVLAYLSLDTLRFEYDKLHDQLGLLNTTCRERTQGLNNCVEIINYMGTKFNNIERKNEMLFQKRTKRGTFDDIGNMASDLFGLLGPKYAEKFDKNMAKLRADTDYIKILQQNNTSIMESTINIVKNNEKAVELHAKQFDSLMAELNRATGESERNQNFHELSAYMMQLLEMYEQQQSAVIGVVSESNQNKINHVLFTPAQIESQTNIISKVVGNAYIVPRGVEIYAASQIRAFRLYNQYIFKISIPLLRPQKFELFKIFRLPIIKTKMAHWIESSKNFIITSADRKLYQLFEEFDRHECWKYKNDGSLICERPSHWFTREKSCCIWNIFTHVSQAGCTFIEDKINAVVHPLEDNRFILACTENTKVTAICNDGVHHDYLGGEGILEVRSDCSINMDNFQLDSKSTFEESNEVIIPMFSPRINKPINTNNLHFSMIDYHYIIIYLVLFGFMLYRIVCSIRKTRNKNETSGTVITESTHRSTNRRVSMPTITV